MVYRVGKQLGNYRITDFLGRGGFAEVYLAEHKLLETQAAIKILQGTFLEQKEQKFFDEARIIAHIIHPNVVRLLDFGIHNKTIPFMVMDYAPNGNLRKLYPKGTQLPLPIVVSYVNQIAGGLQFAHDEKNIIHRDIKPENILVGRRNEILLSDFGIAVIAHSTISRKKEDIGGSPYYMAPEQIQQLPTLASDQYALGVVVYEWLTGSVPFEGTTVADILYKHVHNAPPLLSTKIPTISETVEQVVLKALAKRPEDRFANVQAFALALAEASGEVGEKTLPSRPPIPPVPTPPTPPPLPKEKPHLSRITLLAFIALILLLLSNIFFVINNLATKYDLANATATIGANFATNTESVKATTSANLTATTNMIHTHLTATADVHATASVIPVLHATAVARANASQYPFSYTPGLWQLKDVFPILFTQHTNNHNWDENNQCGFTSQGYLVTQSSPNLPATCFARSPTFSNFTYELHFNILKGDCAGIIFRASSDEKNFYVFLICQDGSYMFVSSVNGSLVQPSKTGTSSAIAKGLNSYNTIGVVARGNNLSFYITKGILFPPVLIYPAQDSNYTQGKIGVIAISLHNKPTQVLFIGAKVWKL